MANTPRRAGPSFSWRVAPAMGLAGVFALAWWVMPGPPPSAQAPSSATAEPRLGGQTTGSAAVVQAMVSGNAALSRGSAFDLGQARAAFERALAIDERYAPAHAGMARALARQAESGTERPGAVLPRAVEHGDRAVELDPGGALGWSALARAEVLWTRDWVRAEAHYRRALAADGAAEEATAGLLELLAAMGRTDEAVALGRRALEPDARSAVVSKALGVALHMAGQHAEAVTAFDKAVAVAGAAAQPSVQLWRGRALASLGQLDAAMEAATLAAEAGAGPTWLSGYVHALAGRRPDAEAVLTAIGARATRAYVPALPFGLVHAALGQSDMALSFLDKAVEERSPGSEFLEVDPLLASLRTEPRFPAILARLKVRPTPTP
jgi:tetratricopeptide (TPR) repeat protein